MQLEQAYALIIIVSFINIWIYHMEIFSYEQNMWNS